MKWQDTSPIWQPQPMSRLRQILSERAALNAPEVLHARFNEATPVSIIVESRVLVAITAHLAQNPHEQGGLLIGEVFGDVIGDVISDVISEQSGQAVQAILVTESLASTEFDTSAISLRMHSTIWREAGTRLNETRLIVGWYHSHPDLGAFFSATDRRTQAAFFAHPYSLGWVIDPIRSEQAWYLGADSRELDLAYYSVLP